MSFLSECRFPVLPPEVVAIIGQYLARQGLACCVRVSKDWHNALIPVLWSVFDNPTFCAKLCYPFSAESCFPERCTHEELPMYSRYIRHLTAYYGPALALLAKDPETCTQLHSLVVGRGELRRCFMLDKDTSIHGGNWYPAEDDSSLQKIKEALCYPSDRVGDPLAQLIRRCHYAQVVWWVALRSANTLTRLHFGDSGILAYFTSVEAFYTMLGRMPAVRELNVPGQGLSIIELTRALPQLQRLHLSDHRTMVAYHFQDLIQVRLDPDKGQLLAGPSLDEVAPTTIKKVVLENSISVAQLRQLLDRFPTLEDICLFPFKTSNTKTDQFSWAVLREAEALGVRWTRSPGSPGKDLLDDAVRTFLGRRTEQASLEAPFLPEHLDSRWDLGYTLEYLFLRILRL
ncbi:hypothetical protein CPC16_000884 [Podila verticillata]|nr:hypothetical protein CPC16_000884 [Podila verticillata]